jgi:aryl-alcohol dehydrogenase-like predicted oxidoreductase
METRQLGLTSLHPSVIGLGTWVMGGWMWGGANDQDSVAAIRTALDYGVNIIDTAPIYGHGHAEKLVGQVLRESGQREQVIVATKVGLEWDAERTKVWRNSTPTRIQFELEASLRRLGIEAIDLYQIHWPDGSTPIGSTMEALFELQRQEKIRFIGVSNFSVSQMEESLKIGAVDTAQPPYNLFERGSERDILSFCTRYGIGTLVYGPLCRGLLSGKYSGKESFGKGDIRSVDPKFLPPKFAEYVHCVNKLKPVAEGYGKSVGQLAVRWCLEQPKVDVALCGARSSQQIEELVGAVGWSLKPSDLAFIDEVVEKTIPEGVGPEFMSPPE